MTSQFAYLSANQPTEMEMLLAAERGIELVPVEECDPFTVNPEHYTHYNGVVLTHPAAVCRFIREGFTVGVFEKAPWGYGLESTITVGFHTYGLRDKK